MLNYSKVWHYSQCGVRVTNAPTKIEREEKSGDCVYTVCERAKDRRKQKQYYLRRMFRFKQ